MFQKEVEFNYRDKHMHVRVPEERDTVLLQAKEGALWATWYEFKGIEFLAVMALIERIEELEEDNQILREQQENFEEIVEQIVS